MYINNKKSLKEIPDQNLFYFLHSVTCFTPLEWSTSALLVGVFNST